MTRNVEVGIDTGGTFTDVVCQEPGQPMQLVKIPSTPHDPAEAVLSAVDFLRSEWGIEPERIARFVHGTTVATNAVLERKGSRIGLLTTLGFEDVIEIGRQLRSSIYDVILSNETPVFLAPGRRRRGVVERVGADGSVVQQLDEQQVRDAIVHLVENEKVECIAVCLLFSFLNDIHEVRIKEIVNELYPAVSVSLSSEVNPEFREYERTVVTAFDAYVKPVINGYIARLEAGLRKKGVEAPLQIMQSRGGVAAAPIARRRPVNLFLSGPAGGVIGGRQAGLLAGRENIITVDVGGTSSDIALIRDGKPILRSEGMIENFPVRTPMVDVNAIGAGGGSIAWIDAGGGLRVGPESAGSDPGPACYGRGGTRATVTDASIVLGYLNPDYFAGGRLKLDKSLSWQVIENTIARPLNISVQEAAAGIHKVVNSQMSEGIRLVTIKQGEDPRKYALIPLGGAGGLHATALADDLGITQIIVPQSPGVLAAVGHVHAPVEHAASVAMPGNLADIDRDEVERKLASLDERIDELMRKEDNSDVRSEIIYSADVSYVGQSHFLSVELHRGTDMFDRLRSDFLSLHDRIFGYATEGALKLSNIHSVHRRHRSEEIGYTPGNTTGIADKAARDVVFLEAGAIRNARIVERSALTPGTRLDGPLIVEQPDTTTIVDQQWIVSVLENGVLLLQKKSV